MAIPPHSVKMGVRKINLAKVRVTPQNTAFHEGKTTAVQRNIYGSSITPPICVSPNLSFFSSGRSSLFLRNLRHAKSAFIRHIPVIIAERNRHQSLLIADLRNRQGFIRKACLGKHRRSVRVQRKNILVLFDVEIQQSCCLIKPLSGFLSASRGT